MGRQMMSYSRIRKIAILSIFLSITLTSKAFCGDYNLFEDFKQGNWRFESLGGSGLSSGDEGDRKGDYYFAGSLEYEWPIFKSRIKVGLRLYPALIYYQDRNDKGKNDTVFAGAFGPVMRQYQYINHKGFYWELGISQVWNSRLFRRNASHWNFLSEIGVGYKFDSDWHIALKFQHISNAQTRSPNEGVNALALCLGFSF
jgi:hypothetical protein